MLTLSEEVDVSERGGFSHYDSCTTMEAENYNIFFYINNPQGKAEILLDDSYRSGSAGITNSGR